MADALEHSYSKLKAHVADTSDRESQIKVNYGTKSSTHHPDSLSLLQTINLPDYVQFLVSEALDVLLYITAHQRMRVSLPCRFLHKMKRDSMRKIT